MIEVESQIAGSVFRIERAVGDTVAQEEVLLILESMKMEIPVEAPCAGTVREISFRTGARMSVMILEAPDEDAAREALASLPFVKAGILTFEVMGLRPYDGWARLFAPAD